MHIVVGHCAVRRFGLFRVARKTVYKYSLQVGKLCVYSVQARRVQFGSGLRRALDTAQPLANIGNFTDKRVARFAVYARGGHCFVESVYMKLFAYSADRVYNFLFVCYRSALVLFYLIENKTYILHDVGKIFDLFVGLYGRFFQFLTDKLNVLRRHVGGLE